jgi:hypothetical protein
MSDDNDDRDCAKRVQEPIAGFGSVRQEPTQFDAGSSEDRLSIAAIQSEGPNCAMR